MARRVTIPDLHPPGAHRPEVVTARLVSSLQNDLIRLADMERRMADFDTVLADLDLVVASAADHRASVLSDAADQVAARVASLKTALGIAEQPAGNDPVTVVPQ